MPSSTTTRHSPPGPSTDSDTQNPSQGARLIPPSTRADGSLRKEIKIRPGYRPPEEVEVYKNRTAEAWKTRGSSGVPGAEGLKDGSADGEKASGKSKKRREARRRAKAAEGGGKDEGGDEGGEGEEEKRDAGDVATENGHATAGEAQAPVEADPEAEREKQARALKKKLRQARELKEKKDSGEGLLPEQFAKVIKIQELIRQLEALGFDSDGGRMAKDAR